jgi:type II restriction enzyme
MTDEVRIGQIAARLPYLSDSQLTAIENIIAQFERPVRFRRNRHSDLISGCVLQEFGDTLRLHHCFSSEAFTKDKFEYALAKVCNLCGMDATLARRGNPGHDITIGTSRVSLKTQADASIKVGYIHISKFMELGKGRWGSDVTDLEGLRERFFRHMDSYDRIFTLRRLRSQGQHLYELVKIPKALLLDAAHGELTMMQDSSQSPKPGYCNVRDVDSGLLKFQQVRLIDKSLCMVHATWRFDDITKEARGVAT